MWVESLLRGQGSWLQDDSCGQNYAKPSLRPSIQAANSRSLDANVRVLTPAQSSSMSPMPPSGSTWLPPRRSKAMLATPAAALGALGAYWTWLTRRASAKPRLWCGEGELKSRVVPLCSLLHQPYTPSPWALNTHLQNVLGFVRGKLLDAGYTRQLVIAHDGGTLGLDWYQGCDAQGFARPDAPVLLVLHGINGGSHEGYCKWVAHCALQRGWRAVVMNYRGCNGLPLTSPRGYAATLTHDVHYAVISIKARFPDAPLFAVGYSLGGVFLTKYIAEADAGLHASAAAANSSFEPFEGSGLVAASVVSSPICLHNSAANLSTPWTTGYLYNMALAYKLREFISHHREAITSSTVLDIDRALQYWTVAAMEDLGGIPRTFGFQSRQEYYEASSSLKHIPHIKTPTLFLVSEDDPFLGVLPDQECSANPHTVLAATTSGGHVAFLQGLWPLGPAWMDAAVLQFLDTAWQHLPLSTHQHRAEEAAAAAEEAAEDLGVERTSAGMGVEGGEGMGVSMGQGVGGAVRGADQAGVQAAAAVRGIAADVLDGDGVDEDDLTGAASEQPPGADMGQWLKTDGVLQAARVHASEQQQPALIDQVSTPHLELPAGALLGLHSMLRLEAAQVEQQVHEKDALHVEVHQANATQHQVHDGDELQEVRQGAGQLGVDQPASGIELAACGVAMEPAASYATAQAHQAHDSKSTLRTAQPGAACSMPAYSTQQQQDGTWQSSPSPVSIFPQSRL